MMFLRFMFCLGLGLVGLSMVLMTVIDTLFSDWDPAHELRGLMRHRHLLLHRILHRSPDDLGLGPAGLATRLNPYGRASRPELTYERTSLPEAASRAAETVALAEGGPIAV
ncbi:MAG: hypothetical protein HY554_05105 [Elusimicrobia bacterium]|nr:hypothetical protein [Elusimicrobiota bacterium]